MSALVSVLMPAYNAERWIGEAIESVLGQSWLRKELIIVDDGSTDGTFELASRYESKAVKLVRQDNRGAAAARNVALDHAQGDFLQWLDADDMLAPDKIARQMQAAAELGDTDAVFSGAFAEFSLSPADGRVTPTLLWRDLDPVEYFLVKFTENLFMHPGAWLVGRSLADRAGRWNECLTLDDDGEYFARVVAASSGVRHVPEARAYYRRANLHCLSRSNSESAWESLALSLRLCIGYLLALEDSPRTRAASMALLQNTAYLWPRLSFDRETIEVELRKIASELGGTLASPQRRWKHEIARVCFGRDGARYLKTLADAGRLQLRLFAAGWSNRRW